MAATLSFTTRNYTIEPPRNITEIGQYGAEDDLVSVTAVVLTDYCDSNGNPDGTGTSFAFYGHRYYKNGKERPTESVFIRTLASMYPSSFTFMLMPPSRRLLLP